MTSFHPTLKPSQFAKYLFASRQAADTQEYLDELFSEKKVYLTDSGRSAFALIIEALDLQGKTVLLPAYVCDALLPILINYKIKPIFIDIERQTFQPPLSAYTDETLSKVDAVLLVATYGQKPDDKLISLLKNRDKIVIEDYAGRDPFYKDELTSHARLYSLPKVLPVPDGGLAILQKEEPGTVPSIPQTASTSLKNILKLLPLVAPLIALLRTAAKRKQTEPAWNQIAAPSRLTQRILSSICQKENLTQPLSPFTYCHPLLVEDPQKAFYKLARVGISAERVWGAPIVTNHKAIEQYGVSSDDFPITKKVSAKIICTPLWHIEDQEGYKKYVQKLEKVLPELGGQ